MRLIVLLAILALMVTPAFAGGGGSGQGGAAPQGVAGEKMMDVEGNVSNINQANKTMDVAGQTLHFSDQTKVVDQQGKEINISALKEGDRVKASYSRQDGKDMANKVEILSGPGMGGAAAPAAPAAPEKKGGGSAY